MMKKKERTPEQKARRFKIATGTVAFLLAFFLVSQLSGGKHEQEETAEEELTAEMDRQLDSLVKDRFADTMKIVWTGTFEPVPFDDDLIPEVIAFREESMRRDVLEMTVRLDSSAASMQELKESWERLKELGKKADEARKKYEGKIFCTARGIHLEGAGGQLYAGFQTYSEDIHSSNIEGLVRINGNN